MSKRTLIYDGHIMVEGDEWPCGWILVEDGSILQMQAGKAPILTGVDVIDARDHFVVPGFIDVHAHGAVGCSCLDGTVDSLERIADYYARHGVTAFLPTLETASRAKTEAALEAIKTVHDKSTSNAAVLGAHLEGPYLNPKRCGAQDIKHIRAVDRSEATAFMDTGIVRLIALAPECPDSHWLIEEAVSRGIVVSAAHTEAGPSEIADAVAIGLSQVTHTYNAMTGLNHRDPGTVGAAMVNDAICCELIADGIHVCPVAMDVLIRTKGLDRVIVITDAVCQAGLSDGEYDLDGKKVIVNENRIQLPDGTLAGAASMMDRNLRNIMQAGRLSLSQAWPLVSLNAAKQLGIDDQKGKLASGYDADIVLLDRKYAVELTLVHGRIAFSNMQR